jgi:hypothetical protein
MLAQLIFAAGVGQLCVLIASALVPVRLRWRDELAPLNPLCRQLFWVYGGYVVLSIVSLGVLCLVNSAELAAGSRLARGLAVYMMLFWGIRLCLQPVLCAREHLVTWWLRAGYHVLTLLFTAFTALFAYAAFC